MVTANQTLETMSIKVFVKDACWFAVSWGSNNLAIILKKGQNIELRSHRLTDSDNLNIQVSILPRVVIGQKIGYFVVTLKDVFTTQAVGMHARGLRKSENFFGGAANKVVSDFLQPRVARMYIAVTVI